MLLMWMWLADFRHLLMLGKYYLHLLNLSTKETDTGPMRVVVSCRVAPSRPFPSLLLPAEEEPGY